MCDPQEGRALRQTEEPPSVAQAQSLCTGPAGRGQPRAAVAAWEACPEAAGRDAPGPGTGPAFTGTADGSDAIDPRGASTATDGNARGLGKGCEQNQREPILGSLTVTATEDNEPEAPCESRDRVLVKQDASVNRTTPLTRAHRSQGSSICSPRRWADRGGTGTITAGERGQTEHGRHEPTGVAGGSSPPLSCGPGKER